jgi:hypothetical protein
MPVYLIERTFAEQLEENPEAIEKLNQINADANVHWLISFLSADKMKTYCLYEAPNPEAIKHAAQLAGIPADKIIEVGEMRNNGEFGEVIKDRFL